MPEVIGERDLRIAQLLDEAVSAMRSGATLDLTSWRERYPDLADEMAELLETLRELDTAASDWRNVVASVDTVVVESADQGTEEPFEFLRPAEQPGELGRLEGYRILELLGSGGMGVVFRAEDTRLKREVALKVMKPSMAAAKSSRDRFAREGQAAARIQHDHIVTIYQVGEDNGIPFLAMQLLDGMSLDERLRREGALGAEEVIRITREIAEGLAAAHAEGLIHRDIKPANIWLEKRPARDGEPPGTRVKILDFGLARVARADALLTQAGAIVGTPAFMAPEQARGEMLDGRCDLFSLGCVMYRMTTGRLPFHAPDAMATLLAVATTSPPSPRAVNPAVPAALSDLIMQCLSKNREERPASALALIEKLQSNSAESTAAPSVMLPARPATRSRTLMRAATVFALIALLAVVAYAVFPPVRSLVDRGMMLALNQGEIVIEAGEEDVKVVIRQPGNTDRVQVVEKHGRRTFVLPAVGGEMEVREWPSGNRAKSKAIAVERGGRQSFAATTLLAENSTPLVDAATLVVESKPPFELTVELEDVKTNLKFRKFTTDGKKEFPVPAIEFLVTLTPVVTPEMAGKFSKEQLSHVVRQRVKLEPGGRDTVRFDLPAVIAKAIPLIPDGKLDEWAGDVGSWRSEQEHGDEIRAEARRGAPAGGIRLWTKNSFGDLELSFQVRLRDNNGVLQVGFRDGEADGQITGYRFHAGNDWQFHDPKGKALTKANIDSGMLQKADANDHYHDVQIRCAGGKVTVRINGIAVHEETIADLPAEGRISFTLLGAGRVEARIRKLELRTLPGAPE